MIRFISRSSLLLVLFSMALIGANAQDALASDCHGSRHRASRMSSGYSYHAKHWPKRCGLCYHKHHPRFCPHSYAYRHHNSYHGGHGGNTQGKLVIIF